MRPVADIDNRIDNDRTPRVLAEEPHNAIEQLWDPREATVLLMTPMSKNKGLNHRRRHLRT